MDFSPPSPLHFVGLSAYVITTVILSLLPFCDCIPAVLPPPWADIKNNPCAARSWQFVKWPPDGKCYRLFQQGPCPETQELGFNSLLKQPECRCPKGTVLHSESKRCYQEFRRGPCKRGRFLAQPPSLRTGRSSTGDPACQLVENCPPNHVFWPQHHKCYALYTRGPCPKGDILIEDKTSGEPKCACLEPDILYGTINSTFSQNLHRKIDISNDDFNETAQLLKFYWPPTRACYEHFTRGPCEKGAIFIYSTETNSTSCACHPRLPNHHANTGLCFQLGTEGPCEAGQWLMFDPISRKAVCKCQDKHVYWPSDGTCYRLYTKGPCDQGEFVIMDKTEETIATTTDFYEEQSTVKDSFDSTTLTPSVGAVGLCMKNPCKRGYLYFPSLNNCYRIGSQGPCPNGKIVMYDEYKGISYRGLCQCSADFIHHYWEPTKQCYELGTRGPCSGHRIFNYNREKHVTECQCNEKQGYMSWENNEPNLNIGPSNLYVNFTVLQLQGVTKGQSPCYVLYSRGPCGWNQWLVPPSKFKHDIINKARCRCKPGHEYEHRFNICLPPTASLFKYFASAR